MRRKLAFARIATFSLALLLCACSGGGGGGGGGAGQPLTAQFAGTTASQWFALCLDLIRQTPGYSPPVASRALGYAGVTLYEAVVPGMPGHRSLAGQVNGLTPPPGADPALSYHWGAVANAALADIFRHLFPVAPPALLAEIDTLEATLAAGFAGEADAMTIDRSATRGRDVAQWIADWSLTDGGKFGYLTNQSPGYMPPAGPGLWEPTPPAFAPALQAFWGINRPFVLEDGDSCQPGPHPAFSTSPSSPFWTEVLEVYDTVNNLTAEQLAIANFWADNPGMTATPPGHWISIINQIADRDGLALDRCAEAFGRVGIAVADSFISCWYCKFDYNLLRPITVVQQNLDPTWTIPLPTPPFPEYTSGHSVQSGAAATVLTALFGEGFAFTDDTHQALGYPARSFSSFEEAADEAAISRLYGGIHFRSAIDLGVTQGEAIGRAVNALHWRDEGGAPAGAPVSSYPADAAIAWFELYRDLIRTTPGFSPPVASRALGCAGVALYEALVPGMPDYHSLAGALNELTALPPAEAGATYRWPLVANAALARVTRLLFATTSAANMAAIDALEQQLAASFSAGVDAATVARSEERGRAVAEAVAFWARSDGGHAGYASNFPASYVPPVGPGLWVPTPPMFQPALQPYWGQNRPFCIAEGSVCPPGAPPPYSEAPTSVFYQQAFEVYTTVNNLTPTQLDIANWWADNPGQTATPPGHSISMTTIVLENEGVSLELAAEAYAKVGIAVCDAFIGCWNAKFQYNLLRPITYVNNVIDPAWTTPVGTPPFPEYTSGHSVQSGAWAEVMTDLFGPGYAFTDDTNVFLGQGARSFGSFFDAAAEAAISRLYGGIHFRAAIEVGVQQGRCIGQCVNALPFRSE